MDAEVERRQQPPTLWQRFMGSRYSDRMRLLELAVVILLTVGGTLGIVAWAGREERADSVTAALCEMADAFRDDEVQDQRVVEELVRMRRLLASGVGVLIDEQTVDELRALIEAQAKEAREAAARPPLPASVAGLCAAAES